MPALSPCGGGSFAGLWMVIFLLPPHLYVDKKCPLPYQRMLLPSSNQPLKPWTSSSSTPWLCTLRGFRIERNRTLEQVFAFSHTEKNAKIINFRCLVFFDSNFWHSEYLDFFFFCKTLYISWLFLYLVEQPSEQAERLSPVFQFSESFLDRI